MDALQTGLLLLPGGLSMGLVAPFVGHLYDRFGPRVLVTPGTLIMAVALGGMTTLDAQSPVPYIISMHVLQCLGLGCVLTPMMTSALASLRPALYSHGSAILNTLQQLAGAIGTSLFVTVMNTVSLSRNHSGTSPGSAQVEGIQVAFIWGVGMTGLALLVSLWTKRPAPTGPGQV